MDSSYLEEMTEFVNKQARSAPYMVRNKLQVTATFKTRDCLTDLEHMLAVRNLLKMKTDITVDCNLEVRNSAGFVISDEKIIQWLFYIIMGFVFDFQREFPTNDGELMRFYPTPNSERIKTSLGYYEKADA